ncbi:MAG: 2Fe-2S iron-sulfur cluster binding domain-containing protein [Holosporales bacterium]|jgi:2Fe-2S ferredoxin|nr:2Fe-2S iron-sulfur cluster binding domain-containing protein [Holosporales bacterium]
MSIKIIFNRAGKITEAVAEVGDTLLETAHKNGIKLFGGCSGAGVCGTCHILVEESYLNKINPPTDEELDIFDIFPNFSSNSRLACQVIVSDSAHGMTVTIPS